MNLNNKIELIPIKNQKIHSSKRIYGYDIARGLAVFIMVFVNFEMVLAERTTSGIYHQIFESLHGKGAALFVVLAGAGMSLMLRSERANNDTIQMLKKQYILLKRAAFLFIFGLLFLTIWPADILHFYGFYISIGTLMIGCKSRVLMLSAFGLIVIYPLIIMVIDYDTGWNWMSTEYSDFWTAKGFMRNLFINGFHPVIPWVAFIFAGLWLGRQDLFNYKVKRNILLVSVLIVVAIQLISHFGFLIFTRNLLLSYSDASSLFGTAPMPPLPLYMMSGISISYIIIILCILFTEQFKTNKWMNTLVFTGQMAFTHYVGHVFIGMLIIYLLIGENELSVEFTFWYSMLFCVSSVVFSWFWRKSHKRGPLSILMRFFTG